MPNKNYLRGRRFEYEVAKTLKEQGYEVMRTAGSHGKFDIIALRSGVKPIFYQCKVTDNERTANRMGAEFKENPPFLGCKEFHQCLMVKVSRTGIQSYWA